MHLLCPRQLANPGIINLQFYPSMQHSYMPTPPRTSHTFRFQPRKIHLFLIEGAISCLARTVWNDGTEKEV
jgi:hypothetical protein